MSHRKVYECVSRFVPCRHMEWSLEEDVPPLPWAIYTGEEHPVCADNSTLAVRNDWTVELYEHARDAEIEKALGEAIRAEFGNYTRRESWVKSEDCLIVTYEFHEIEGVDNDCKEQG